MTNVSKRLNRVIRSRRYECLLRPSTDICRMKVHMVAVHPGRVRDDHQARISSERLDRRHATWRCRPKADAPAYPLAESAQRVSENTVQARYSCIYDASYHSSMEFMQWRSAQHQFVVIAHRRPQPPARYVDTAMAGATAIAVDTAAPLTRRIHQAGRAATIGGAPGDHRAAGPGRVGRAPAPPSRTHRRR